MGTVSSTSEHTKFKLKNCQLCNENYTKYLKKSKILFINYLGLFFEKI
jgi:hypothetical protein